MVRYRETGPYRRSVPKRDYNPKMGGNYVKCDWFGFTLRVAHPGVAHIAAFELPADEFRRIPVSIIDPQTGLSNGADCEVLPGSGDGGAVTMLVPFWPNVETVDGLVMPSNYHGDPRSTPGAVAHVTLWECPGGFPALPEAAGGWNPGRLVGWAGEQGNFGPERAATPPQPGGATVPAAHNRRADPFYDYTAYDLAWRRHGEWARWNGVNYLRWPLHSYDMAHAQAESLPWGNAIYLGEEAGRPRIDKYRRNNLKIILLECERHGLRFWGDLHLNNNVGRELANGIGLGQILSGEAGHPKSRQLLLTMLRVGAAPDLASLEGAFLEQTAITGGNLTPAHPAARRYYARLFGDLAAACAVSCARPSGEA